MFDRNSEDLFSAVQNLDEIRISGPEVSGHKDSVGEVATFLRDAPGTARAFPQRVHPDLGHTLIKLGVSYGRRARKGQIPALAGETLGRLGKDFPLTVGQGIEKQMDVVRGGIAWTQTSNRKAQSVRFDTLDIIHEALRASVTDQKAGNDKVTIPNWVNPKLVQFVVETIVWPHFTDGPMIEECLGRMEDAIYVSSSGVEKVVRGNKPDEVAEVTTSKGCETLEVLLLLAPHLAEVAREAVRKTNADIHSDDYLLDRRIYSVGVVALELADVTITKATELSREDAVKRLRNMPRRKASLVI